MDQVSQHTIDLCTAVAFLVIALLAGACYFYYAIDDVYGDEEVR